MAFACPESASVLVGLVVAVSLGEGMGPLTRGIPAGYAGHPAALRSLRYPALSALGADQPGKLALPA